MEPAAVLAWEVMITDAWDRPLGPGSHPWLFRGRPWLFHWLNPPPECDVPIGRQVPTHVVQQILDFLAGAAPLAPLPRETS